MTMRILIKERNQISDVILRGRRAQMAQRAEAFSKKNQRRI